MKLYKDSPYNNCNRGWKQKIIIIIRCTYCACSRSRLTSICLQKTYVDTFISKQRLYNQSSSTYSRNLIMYSVRIYILTCSSRNQRSPAHRRATTAGNWTEIRTILITALTINDYTWPALITGLRFAFYAITKYILCKYVCRAPSSNSAGGFCRSTAGSVVHCR